MLPRSWLKGTLDKLDVNEVKLQRGCFRQLLQLLQPLIRVFSATSGMFSQDLSCN